MIRLHERVPLAAALDVGLVTAFVAVGRRNHDQDPGVIGLISTAAPFLVGLAVGWLLSKAWNDPLSIRSGLIIWPITVAVGMGVRQLGDDGTAWSFVIVATLSVGASLVGWRAIGAAITTISAKRASA